MKAHHWTIIALVPLAVVYLLTLQTIPNGSSHYFMIDVGETQIVLNNWGTLHATGYPLYVISGNILTAILTTFGIAEVTAPALVSFVWGIITLALLFWLLRQWTTHRWLAAAVVVVFGLTRTIWIHHVIAEIYTFGLLLQVGLLALAFWPGTVKGRIYWMALLGGVAVAHHRATAMMIPALLVAVAPILWQERRNLPKIVLLSVAMGTVGFAQYAYLYLRAQAGADWVYGEPGTLSGLWDEFIGREAQRFIGPPDSVSGLLENIETINLVLIRDLTVPGIVAGIAGIVYAIVNTKTRRIGASLALLAVVAYGFHISWYTDVLSALILLVTLALACGWLFAADAMLRVNYGRWLVGAAAGAAAVYMIAFNLPFITDVTEDPTGEEVIAELAYAPPGSTVMLAWGPRYFAASIGQLFLDELDHIALVDDKVDFTTVDAPLLTPDYTFFQQPLSWWGARLGPDVTLAAAAPRLVEIRQAPTFADTTEQGIAVMDATVTCDPLALNVIWTTGESPTEDLSVYVHGLDATGAIIAQGDQSAPVYGWRPTTSWRPNEVIRDVYPLMGADALNAVETIRYGMYRVTGTGFENVSEFTTPATCVVTD